MAHLVVADTGPINYLILVGQIDLLDRLFEKVIIPAAVAVELASRRAPQSVQFWIAAPPVWLEVGESPSSQDGDASLDGLDHGEKTAILLALSIHAELLLIDDRMGVKAARRKGIRVTGTLGILEMAAQAGLVDFELAVEKLRRTTFRGPEALLESMIKKHKPKENGNG